MYILRDLPQFLQADTSNPAMTPTFTPQLCDLYNREGGYFDDSLNTVERQLYWLIWTANHPDKQKIRIINLKNRLNWQLELRKK